MKVMKFGGTSVADSTTILNVFDIVKTSTQSGTVAVVVSAFGGVTDSLINASKLAEAGDENYKEAFNNR